MKKFIVFSVTVERQCKSTTMASANKELYNFDEYKSPAMTVERRTSMTFSKKGKDYNYDQSSNVSDKNQPVLFSHRYKRLPGCGWKSSQYSPWQSRGSASLQPWLQRKKNFTTSTKTYLLPWQLSDEQVHNYDFQQKRKSLQLWPVEQREWPKSASDFFSPL